MICLNCQVATSNPKFCSNSCSASYNNKAKPKRKPEGKCVHCDSPCVTRSKYCSQPCKTKTKTINKLKKNKILKSNGIRVIEWRKRTKIKSVEYKRWLL